MKKVSAIVSCIYNENTGWWDVTTEVGCQNREQIIIPKNGNKTKPAPKSRTGI